MTTKVRFVGLDVHKDSIVMADSGRQPAEVFTKLANDFRLLKKALAKLGPAERLRICYEAGSTGFDLARRLSEAGYHCEVVAPSLVPQHSGKKRIRTDRRDAHNLAQFHRSGNLTAVCIPERQMKVMRDLERARDDAKHAERAAKHQLDKFLLRPARLVVQAAGAFRLVAGEPLVTGLA